MDTHNRLVNKVAIVTGASSGLGRAIALLFALEGAKLVVCADLVEQARSEIVEECSETTHAAICRIHGTDRAMFQRTNVTSPEDVEACVKTTISIAGRLDVIVNNAGRTPTIGRVHETSEEVWESSMAVNSRGVFHGCKYACAQFLNQALDENSCRGRIVNISSAAGLVAFPVCAAYCSSKGATTLLTKAVAIDYAKDAIYCNAVCPSYVKTGMTVPLFETDWIVERMRTFTPMWSAGSGTGTEAVARAALFLASSESAWVTGAALPVDGGLTAT